MNRSFSTFTKRILLAASIGLVAAHSSAAVFADDESEPQQKIDVQKSEATASTSEGGTVTTHSSSTTDQNGKQQNRVIVIQRGSPSDEKLPLTYGFRTTKLFPAEVERGSLPPGVKQVVETSEVDGKPVQTIRYVDAEGKPVTVQSAGTQSGTTDIRAEGSNVIISSGGTQLTSPYIQLINNGEPAIVSPYWIGAELRPLNETMRWMLKLPENRGIAVFKIMPDSSAAKAGLKERDILIKADEKVLSVPAELMGILAKSEGKKLRITYIRDLDLGKEITTTIKPDKRSEAMTYDKVWDPGKKEMVEVVRGIKSGISHSGDVLQFLPQAGFAVPPMMHTQMIQAHAQMSKLPDDLSISISRTGDKPAEIKVKQGEKTWEVTDKELDKLPEEIRKHVQNSFSVGANPGDVRFFVNAQPATIGGTVSGGVITQAAPFTPGQPLTMPVPPPNAEAIQKQAEAHHQKIQEEIAKAQAAQQAAMQKQMQALQKQVEAIQKQMEKK